MRPPLGLLLLLVFVSASCGPKVDLTKGLKINIVSSGWFDAGIVNGNQNKLVPQVVFTLTNTANQSLPVLQINASFHRGTENEEWGNAFVMATAGEALAAGATTPPL